MTIKPYHKIFSKDYFTNRFGNDPKRQKSFAQEKDLINKYISSGTLLDIGCSTGEFIQSLGWPGKCFGMEISPYAISVAMKKGIKFGRDLSNTKNYFDLIIFRGTIQHLDTPFAYLKKTYSALKPGGFVVFLATPNANSIYYKLWNTLPFLAPVANFYIPSDVTLTNAMKNFGFILKEIRYPYLTSPYASFFRDHLNFIKKLLGFNVKFAFWRNSIELVFQKPRKTKRIQSSAK